MAERPIGPTPERLRKAGENVEAFTPDENLHHRAIRLLDGHILARLAARSVITGDQHNAGSQYYSDWYHSGLAASGVIDPAKVIVDGGQRSHESDRKLSAMTRYKRAVIAIGFIHSTVLTDLVLLEKSIEEWSRKWFGQKSPKIAKAQGHAALVLALTALDHHYYGQRKTGVRAAHMEGSRPEIMPVDGDAS